MLSRAGIPRINLRVSVHSLYRSVPIAVAGTNCLSSSVSTIPPHSRRSLNSSLVSPRWTHDINASGQARFASTRAPPSLGRLTKNKEIHLHFNSVELAFKSKSDAELYRALLVFQLCKTKWLVRNSDFLLKLGFRFLGDTIMETILKKTFFGHFCAGETHDEIQPVIKQFQDAGIGSILDYAAEADVDEEDERDLGVDKSILQSRTYELAEESEYDANMEITMQAVEAAARAPGPGFAAVKVTSLGRPEFLQHISMILSCIRRAFRDIHNEYCSQVETRKSDDKVEKPNVLMVDRKISAEAFKKGLKAAKVNLSDKELDEMFKELDGLHEQDDYIDYLEWTTLLDPATLSLGKLDCFVRAPQLSKDEVQKVRNMINRLQKLAKAAHDNGVMLMVDAEQTYMQPAIDHLVLQMQRRYNKERAVVFNTFQCYLRDSEDRIRTDLARAKAEKWIFACKLVRGAYMVQERKRAYDMSYGDPIQPNIEFTHENYNRMVGLLLSHNHMCNFMVASHNEDSVKRTAERMEELGIKRKGSGVYFAQLMGMCDHITYSLGHAGYQVYNYVPYGPIKEVLPYLVRRAQENSGLMSNVDKEIALVRKELLRRKKEGK